jgi:hypothetical protein
MSDEETSSLHPEDKKPLREKLTNDFNKKDTSEEHIKSDAFEANHMQAQS